MCPTYREVRLIRSPTYRELTVIARARNFCLSLNIECIPENSKVANAKFQQQINRNIVNKLINFYIIYNL